MFQLILLRRYLLWIRNKIKKKCTNAHIVGQENNLGLLADTHVLWVQLESFDWMREISPRMNSFSKRHNSRYVFMIYYPPYACIHMVMLWILIRIISHKVIETSVTMNVWNAQKGSSVSTHMRGHIVNCQAGAHFFVIMVFQMSFSTHKKIEWKEHKLKLRAFQKGVQLFNLNKFTSTKRIQSLRNPSTMSAIYKDDIWNYPSHLQLPWPLKKDPHLRLQDQRCLFISCQK